MALTKALSFSGGKDSLACLFLLEPLWNELVVVWGNTGAAHPSTHEMMERVRKRVPHFREVKSNQPAFIAEYGYPVDVLPTRRTRFGQQLDDRGGRKFVDWQSCCATNLWVPMYQAMKDMGIRTVYRGQKKADMIRSPIKSGHTEDGITYIFPLEDWTDAKVFEYLGERVPDHYLTGEKTSRDCVNCTAYLHENQQRIAALPAQVKAEVIEVLADLRACMQESVDYIDDIIGGRNGIVR